MERLMKVLNVALMTAIMGAVMHFYYEAYLDFPVSKWELFLILAVYGFTYCSVARIFHGFWTHLVSKKEILFSQFLAAAIVDILYYFIFALIVFRKPMKIGPMLVLWTAQAAVSAAWAFVMGTVAGLADRKKVIIVYGDRKELIQTLVHNGLNHFMYYKSAVPVEIAVSAPQEAIGDADALMICDVHSHERNQLVKYCVEHDVDIYVIPRIGDMLMSGAHRMHFLHMPMLKIERYCPTPEYVITKRLFDVIISVCALIALSPLLAIVSICIKCSDHGDVFYRQVRLTKDGKEFVLYKFRSMSMNAEKDGIARLSSGKSDARVTPVGKVLRATRLDELPQLINILKGEMSVVGPRPERPEIAAEYEKELPEFRLRLQTKAGLTGYAQVYGKYNTTPYDKLLLDLMYISSPSLITDLKIIIATVKVLFSAESTEGIAEGQTTAIAHQWKEGKSH